MDPFAPPPQTADAPGLLNLRIRLALTLLKEARAAAAAVERDVWEFAVGLGQLRAAGVTDTDLRWLLCLGYVEHGLERTRGGARRRSFRRLGTLSVPEGS